MIDSCLTPNPPPSHQMASLSNIHRAPPPPCKHRISIIIIHPSPYSLPHHNHYLLNDNHHNHYALNDNHHNHNYALNDDTIIIIISP